MKTVIEKIIKRSHATAVEKGWWPNGVEGRSIAEQTNNFHAEISEAWEEYRKGRMELWFSFCGDFRGVEWHPRPGVRHCEMIGLGCKPEGYWVEIADLVIRIADTFGAYGWEPTFHEPAKKDMDAPEFVDWLHSMIAYSADRTRWGHAGFSALDYVVSRCIVNAPGVGLFALCDLKMSYNETRPSRHGGKLA